MCFWDWFILLTTIGLWGRFDIRSAVASLHSIPCEPPQSQLHPRPSVEWPDRNVGNRCQIGTSDRCSSDGSEAKCGGATAAGPTQKCIQLMLKVSIELTHKTVSASGKVKPQLGVAVWWELLLLFGRQTNFIDSQLLRTLSNMWNFSLWNFESFYLLLTMLHATISIHEKVDNIHP